VLAVALEVTASIPMKKPGEEKISVSCPVFSVGDAGGILARFAVKDALRDVKKKFLSFMLRRVKHIGMCKHSEQALHPSLNVRQGSLFSPKKNP